MKLIVKILLIVWGSQLFGCSPRTASILVQNNPKPKIDHIEYNERYHTIQAIYNVAEFRDLIANENISKVKVFTLSGQEICSERITVAAGTVDSVYSFSKDRTVAVALNQVEKVVLYERIPSQEKRQNFLVQALVWPVMAVGLQLGNGKDFNWSTVGNSACIGVALGSIFLARKHRETEKVLVAFKLSLD